MTSMKKADLALRLMIQVRNKIMDAYTEIKQMQM
jgi:flagellar hook-basal body complex protein FliE